MTYEEKETTHRVIVGREYYEPFGVEPETVVGRAMAFLVKKRVPRQTEGVCYGRDPRVLNLRALGFYSGYWQPGFETVVGRAMSFLVKKRVPRQT